MKRCVLNVRHRLHVCCLWPADIFQNSSFIDFVMVIGFCIIEHVHTLGRQRRINLIIDESINYLVCEMIENIPRSSSLQWHLKSANSQRSWKTQRYLSCFNRKKLKEKKGFLRFLTSNNYRVNSCCFSTGGHSLSGKKKTSRVNLFAGGWGALWHSWHSWLGKESAVKCLSAAIQPCRLSIWLNHWN